MLQWIVDNKQWLFSGIGITLILGIFYLVRKLLNRGYDKPEHPTSISPESEKMLTQPGSNVNLASIRNDIRISHPISSSLEPEKIASRPIAKLDFASIRDNIESLPPYQRKQAMQNYIGLRFEFTGQLEIAEAIDNEQINFCLRKSDQHPLVFVKMREKEFPELKILHKGTMVTVQGNIADFTLDWVRLDNVVIINYIL